MDNTHYTPFLEEQRASLLDGLDRISEQTRQLATTSETSIRPLVQSQVLSSDEVEAFQKRVLAATSYVRDQVVAMTPDETIETLTTSAFRALNGLQALDTEVRGFSTTLQPFAAQDEQAPVAVSAVQTTKSQARAVWDWLTKHLEPLIKKVSQYLWNLISGLLTPKSWTVEGDFGSPLLGLASVKISVTFGSSGNG